MGDILTGILGKIAYDGLKEYLKVLASEIGYDKLTGKLLKCFNEACECFFKKYRREFGLPHESFLAKRKNWEIIAKSLYFNKGTVAPKDIDNQCDTGVKPATPEAISFFIECLLKEVDKDLDLSNHFSNKRHVNVTREMHEQVGSIINFMMPMQDDIEKITLQLRTAAKADINAFKNKQSWPKYVVPLNMIMKDSSGGVHLLSHADVAAKMEYNDEISIIAAPGTGKTTMMVQLADTILASDAGIAVVIPLAGWSLRKENFFQSLTRRRAFSVFNEQHFMLLASHGQLLLLLDGWNELDQVSKKLALNDLEALRRDFPRLRIAISTRRQAQVVPINGPEIDIGALSEEQQLEMARALRKDEGAALLEQAWRTEGMRELISIPLYLNSLLAYATCGTMPTTKEEVLRNFVEEHERAPGRAKALDQELLGCHREFLIGLAVVATSAGKPTISDKQARTVISHIGFSLEADGQITSRPEPKDVLNVLVNNHLLVLPGDNSDVSFHHQQFQEWYASFEVEKLMRDSESGNVEALKKLSANVLNMPAWEESILFACERLSFLDQTGIKAVAAAILRCIQIDPMLAAEMIYRSSQAVWNIIKGEAEAFAIRWHKPDTVDRAVGFMITTGRPEFAEMIWSLITNSDTQVHLETLRVARQFRPSVLGVNIQEKMAVIPEKVRKSILVEIVMEGGIDGINLATMLAKAESSANVQFTVIEALLFRSAERFATDILRVAPEDVWHMLASGGYVNEFTDTEIVERLQQERQSNIANQTSIVEKIELLLEDRGDGSEIGTQIESLIISTEFPIKEDHAYWKLKKAKAQYPQEITRAILRRIEMGREVSRFSDLLKDSAFVEDGTIIDMIVDTTQENRQVDAASVVVGPKTVSKLIDKLLLLDEKIKELNWRIDEATHKEYWRLIDRICNSKLTAFLPALQHYSNTYDPQRIKLLADLLARYGQNIKVGFLEVEEVFHKPLIKTINQWVEVLLQSPVATRHHFVDVVRAIVWYPKPEFFDGLQRLLAEDLAQWKQSKQEFSASPVRGQMSPDVTHSYTNIYGDAFVAIGDDKVVQLMFEYLSDLQFGFESACVLKKIWAREQNVYCKKLITTGPDFSEAAERQQQRQKNGISSTSSFSDAIFIAIDDIIQPNCGEAEHQHTLKLAKIAVSMPHGDKTAIINDLLLLPRPLSEKRELLTSLVLAGYRISADMVLEGLKGLLEEAKQKPWLLDEHQNLIEDWLKLLPFSDRPEALHEALALDKACHKEPRQLQSLLSALAYAPNTQAELSLFKLAEDDPRFYKENEWLNAVVHRGTVSSATLLLDLICNGKMGSHLDSWSLARKISGLFNSHPDVCNDLIRRYGLLPEVTKSVIRHVMAEVANEDGLLALVRGYGEEGRNFDQTLNAIIENIALVKNSLGHSQAFEYDSVDVSNLRQKLFAMLNEGGAVAKVAESCLTAIDELRDEYGCVDSEPRHPDIESGRPWPLAAICIKK